MFFSRMGFSLLQIWGLLPTKEWSSNAVSRVFLMVNKLSVFAIFWWEVVLPVLRTYNFYSWFERLYAKNLLEVTIVLGCSIFCSLSLHLFSMVVAYALE